MKFWLCLRLILRQARKLFCFITYFYIELENTQTQDVHVLFICKQERQVFLHSVPQFLVAGRGNSLPMERCDAGVPLALPAPANHKSRSKRELRVLQILLAY